MIKQQGGINIKKSILFCFFIATIIIVGTMKFNQDPLPVYAKNSDEQVAEDAIIVLNQIREALNEKGIKLKSQGLHYDNKEIYANISETKQPFEKVEADIWNIINGIVKESIFKDYKITIYNNFLFN
ncbi:MAG TPA: hypothetical protein VNM69_11715 [Bacillus sp. (in: firmicutes)]|uniref:hypothetical protein n=1 Tax=Bacillus litorisediminis TaxID=2922713 RepID=UPI001FAF7FE0|nr:hypothetical protein [Bacillus litorisediminis]HWO76544.1 hypothetical protein [Bacillus sp. (in: firmicutes)]